MPKGGKREGAGRKPGSKALATKQALEAAGKGEMPLEYMLRVMRDPKTEDKRRDAMATAAAAFIHPRLSNVTGSFVHKHEPTDLSDAELAHIASSRSAGVAEQANGAAEPSKLH